MFVNQLPPRGPPCNLHNYEDSCREFSWEYTNKEFSWYHTGRVNIAHEAIDRHAANPATARLNCLTFDYGNRILHITYKRMRLLSNKLGNVLLKHGAAKGDRVMLYLSRIPELYIAMAGCAKIGAVIVPMYTNYREKAVKERMLDAEANLLITTPRYSERIPEGEFPGLKKIIMVGAEPFYSRSNTVLWNVEMADASDELECEWVPRDHPFLMVYTAGQNGKPVGLMYGHDAMRGYHATARLVLDIMEGDVLRTQARPGWLLNVVYTAFAPWLCGIESFVTGEINSAETLYRFIEQHQVTILYTLPTIYRMIAKADKKTAQKYNLKSLRHVVSVLEPLTPDVIYAVMRVLRLPVHDTWWTAETGMISIANFPCLPIKPGYMGKPCPGMLAAVLESAGNEAGPFTMGQLALKMDWPSMMMGVWEKGRLVRRHVHAAPWFLSGDTAFVDQDGYFFHQGRTKADEIIITSTGKIGIGEIEDVIMMHPAVREAGAMTVCNNHGKRIVKAFVRLRGRNIPGDILTKSIRGFVEERMSPEVVPEEVVFCKTLPKDSSGKLLRVVLKAWELGLPTGNIQGLCIKDDAISDDGKEPLKGEKNHKHPACSK